MKISISQSSGLILKPEYLRGRSLKINEHGDILLDGQPIPKEDLPEFSELVYEPEPE